MGLEDKIQGLSQRVEEKRQHRKQERKMRKLGINVQGPVAGPLSQREDRLAQLKRMSQK